MKVSQKPVIKKPSTRLRNHTRRVGELRFITPACPEESARQALSPEPRGYRVFIDLLWEATLAANRLV